MAEPTYEPHFRWWVCEKSSGTDWLVIRKTRWRWFARSLARRKARQGYRMRVEDRG